MPKFTLPRLLVITVGIYLIHLHQVESGVAVLTLALLGRTTRGKSAARKE